MKLILVLLIVAYSRSSNAVGDNFPPDLDINDMSTFKGFDNHMGINPWKDSIETIGQKFAKNFGRNYGAEEYKARLPLILECVENIKIHIVESHLGQTTFNVALTQLCDKTDAEKAALLGGKIPTDIIVTSSRRKRSGIYNTQCLPTTNSTLPTSYDARNLSIVTSVKNQLQCGDCWAFASTAAFESRILKLGGASLDLSEQYLLNCVNYGCNGASIDSAYQFVINNGQATEAAMPYNATVEACNYCPLKNGYKMTDYCGFGYNYTTTYSNGTKVSTTDTTPGSDANIMRYIKEQGVVVGMLNATNLASSGYSSGIYSYATCPTCSSCTNHAIVIVGWGTQNGTDYWIIKNSWGSSWGESGYFRMKRGVNMCAINNWFYFPIVSSTAPINITCSSG